MDEVLTPVFFSYIVEHFNNNTMKTAKKKPVKTTGKKTIGQLLDEEHAKGNTKKLPPLPLPPPANHYEVRFDPSSTITFVYNDARVTLTGQELFNVADVKKKLERTEAELQKMKDQKPLPSIPKMDDVTKLQHLRDVYDIQKGDGNWNHDPYQFGMFNGLELAMSIIEDRPVNFKDKPAKWIDKDEQEHRERMEQKAGVTMTVNERERTADELVDELLDRIVGREQIFPAILQRINERLLDKLRRDAEQLGERTAIARKRFEEAHMTIQEFAKR